MLYPSFQYALTSRCHWKSWPPCRTGCLGLVSQEQIGEGRRGTKRGDGSPFVPFFFNQGIALLKLRSRLSVDSRLKCSVPGNMDATVKHQATVEQREPRYDERKNTVITDISKQFENGRAGLVMHCSVKVKVKKTDKAKRRLALSGQQRLWRWRPPKVCLAWTPVGAGRITRPTFAGNTTPPDTCCTLFTVFTVYTFPTRRLPSYRSSLLHLEHLSTSSTCNWH